MICTLISGNSKIEIKGKIKFIKNWYSVDCFNVFYAEVLFCITHQSLYFVLMDVLFSFVVSENTVFQRAN